MPMSNASAAAFLGHLFENLAWATVGDTSGLQPSGGAGSFYIALHSADPLISGNQNSSEMSYTGYARIGVPRSSGGWTLTGTTISNAVLQQFGACTAGSATAAFWSLGTVVSGTGQIIVYSNLVSSLAISTGIQPQFAIGALTATAS